MDGTVCKAITPPDAEISTTRREVTSYKSMFGNVDRVREIVRATPDHGTPYQVRATVLHPTTSLRGATPLVPRRSNPLPPLPTQHRRTGIKLPACFPLVRRNHGPFRQT